MRIRTLNKRRMRYNIYKSFFLAHLNSAIKYLNSPGKIMKFGVQMYYNHLKYIGENKKYKQFYFEMIDQYKNKSKTT